MAPAQPSSRSTRSPVHTSHHHRHPSHRHTLSNKHSTTITSAPQDFPTATRRPSRGCHASHTSASTVASATGAMSTEAKTLSGGLDAYTDTALSASTYQNDGPADPAPTSTDDTAGYTDSSSDSSTDPATDPATQDCDVATVATDSDNDSVTQISTSTRRRKTTTRSSSTCFGDEETVNASETGSDSSTSAEAAASTSGESSHAVQSTVSSLYAIDEPSTFKTSDGTDLLPIGTSSTTSTHDHPTAGYQSTATDKSFFNSNAKVAGVFTAVGIVLVAVLLGLLIYCFRRRQSKARSNDTLNRGLLVYPEKGYGVTGSTGTGLNEVHPSIERTESRQSIPPVPPILPSQYYVTQPTVDRALAPADAEFANGVSEDSAYSQDGATYQSDLERGYITPPEIVRIGRRWSAADRIDWGAAARIHTADTEHVATGSGTVNNAQVGHNGFQAIDETTATNLPSANHTDDIPRVSPSRNNAINRALSRGSMVHGRSASDINTPTVSLPLTPLTPQRNDWSDRLRQLQACANSNTPFRTLVTAGRSLQLGTGADNGYEIRRLPTAREMEESIVPGWRTDVGSPEVSDPVKGEGKRYSVGGRTALESWENLHKSQETRRKHESVLREKAAVEEGDGQGIAVLRA